ncbi:MAG: hypothetical protein R3B09_32605 [Nannocystaceae bacterium]
MLIHVRRAALRRALVTAVGAVIALGAAAEGLRHFARGLVRADFLSLLSLSYEGNLPTWASAALLALAGGLLAVIAAGAVLDRGRWWLLSAGFFYISFDEVVGVHEAIDAMFENTGGLFYFGWIIPAAGLVALLALFYVPFLRRLPASSRRRFVLAGALYVGGALLLELPLGLWTEHAGPDNWVYAAIDLVEESLEMIGVTVFILALVDHLVLPDGALTLTMRADARG